MRGFSRLADDRFRDADGTAAVAQRIKDPNSAYSRRVQRAMARGLSLSQARGHPKAGESFASGEKGRADARVSNAVERIKAGGSLSESAKVFALSRERLRRALAEHGDYVREGSRHRFVRWQRNDFPLYSAGKSIRVIVDDENARKLGAYMSATDRFFSSNKAAFIAPYIGAGVTDTQGRFHPFETDLKLLYELRAKGRPVFHQIYQQ